jgi:hypothetical protein
MRLANPNYNMSVRNSKVFPLPQEAISRTASAETTTSTNSTAHGASAANATIARTGSGSVARTSSGQVLEANADGDAEEDANCHWTTCAHNAYGAWIHVALQAGLHKATVMTLPMALCSIFVQTVFSFQLIWYHWPDFRSEVS